MHAVETRFAEILLEAALEDDTDPCPNRASSRSGRSGASLLGVDGEEASAAEVVPVWAINPESEAEKPLRRRRKAAGDNEIMRRGEENAMVTWVLMEEPNAAVRRAIELIEERVESDADVMWLCPSESVEPVQE